MATSGVIQAPLVASPLLRDSLVISRLVRLAWESASEGAVVLFSRDFGGEPSVRVFAEPDGPTLFRDVQEAVALLRGIYPTQYERLRQYCGRIVVADVTGASFWTRSHSCVLPSRLVRRGPAARIALTLAHEAEHGRLNGLVRNVADRRRVELVAVDRQLRFLVKLRETGYGGTEAWSGHLTELAKGEWYSSNATYRARTQFLSGLQPPRWLDRLHGFAFRPRQRPGKKRDKE